MKALKRGEGVSRRLRAMGRSGYVCDGETPCASHRPIAGDGEEMKKQVIKCVKTVIKTWEINTQMQGIYSMLIGGERLPESMPRGLSSPATAADSSERLVRAVGLLWKF